MGLPGPMYIVNNERPHLHSQPLPLQQHQHHHQHHQTGAMMPPPSIRPDGPSNGPSLTSYPFASPYRSSQQRNFARPRQRVSRPSPSIAAAARPGQGMDQEQQRSPVLNSVSATTAPPPSPPPPPPPPLSVLLTPSSSDIYPALELPASDITDDENAPYPILVKANTLNSVLDAFTPDRLQQLRASRESSFIFRNITPKGFSDWEGRYPELYEAKGVGYDYDGLSQRMIIRCMSSSVHHSFPIYFTRVVNRGLDRVGPECRRALQMFASTDFSNFKGEYADTNTRKSPDAYVRVASSHGFPSVVVEVGWAASMDDLMADARLWLLGTDGQTKAAIIVSFTEAKCGILSQISSPPDRDLGTDTKDADPEGPDVDAEADLPEPTEEEEHLLSTVDSTTGFSALATSILELHLRGALAVPLLGSLTATFHVFRRTADTIYEEFVTPVLPAPDPDGSGHGDQVQSYTLTLADMYGDNPLPASEDANHRFVIDMDDFRRDIAYQVPDVEEKRSLNRAKAILKRRGLWRRKATFTGKRKRGEGDGEAECTEKRAR